MTDQIPYYRVLGRRGKKYAYWCPNKRMKSLGFEVTALGPDGPEARTLAAELVGRWREVQSENPGRLGVRVLPRGAREETAAHYVYYVYFLRVGQKVKIGTSRTPISRVSSLATSIPDQIDQLVVVRGGRADEKRLHRRFKCHRTHGEWFAASVTLQHTIIRCAAAGVVVHDDDGGPNRERGVESQEGDTA